MLLIEGIKQILGGDRLLLVDDFDKFYLLERLARALLWNRSIKWVKDDQFIGERLVEIFKLVDLVLVLCQVLVIL